MALVILGLGNDLLGDDGIGLLAASQLERRFGPDVAVRTSGLSGLYLIEPLEGFDDAIIIDAVVGDHPGRVRELGTAEIRPVSVPSAHYAGLPEALALARSSGMAVPRRLRIFAVEMDSTQIIGTAPSEAVMEALPELTSLVARAAGEWGYA